jgi:hypothetical protein
VIAPIDLDGEQCLASCEKLTGVSARQSLAPAGLFGCLRACRGARVESGPCDVADLLPTERCWTERRSLLLLSPSARY